MKRITLKTLLIAAGFAAVCAAPASADTIAALAQNTLTLTDAAGRVTTVLLNADASFQQVDPIGMQAAGFWALDGGAFCMTARGKARVCFALPADKAVGDTFDLAGPTGRVVWTAAIVEGRADLAQLASDIRGDDARSQPR